MRTAFHTACFTGWLASNLLANPEVFLSPSGIRNWNRQQTCAAALSPPISWEWDGEFWQSRPEGINWKIYRGRKFRSSYEAHEKIEPPFEFDQYGFAPTDFSPLVQGALAEILQESHRRNVETGVWVCHDPKYPDIRASPVVVGHKTGIRRIDLWPAFQSAYRGQRFEERSLTHLFLHTHPLTLPLHFGDLAAIEKMLGSRPQDSAYIIAVPVADPDLVFFAQVQLAEAAL